MASDRVRGWPAAIGGALVLVVLGAVAYLLYGYLVGVRDDLVVVRAAMGRQVELSQHLVGNSDTTLQIMRTQRQMLQHQLDVTTTQLAIMRQMLAETRGMHSDTAAMREEMTRMDGQVAALLALAQQVHDLEVKVYAVEQDIDRQVHEVNHKVP